MEWLVWDWNQRLVWRIRTKRLVRNLSLVRNVRPERLVRNWNQRLVWRVRPERLERNVRTKRLVRI